MNKTLITGLLFLYSFLIYAQDSTITILVKRPVLFYLGEIKFHNEITIQRHKLFTYTPASGQQYLSAIFENQKGYVPADQVSPLYQDYDTWTNSDIQLNINEAGRKIQGGANTILFGTAIALLGSGVGILIAKNNPDLGYPVAAAASGLGFIITIGGYGSIASGGRKLKEYKTAK